MASSTRPFCGGQLTVLKGLFSLLSFIKEIPVQIAKTVDQDQMPRSAASDLGLLCFPASLLCDALYGSTFQMSYVENNNYQIRSLKSRARDFARIHVPLTQILSVCLTARRLKLLYP